MAVKSSFLLLCSLSLGNPSLTVIRSRYLPFWVSNKLASACHMIKSSASALNVYCQSSRGAISASLSKLLAAKRANGIKACCTLAGSTCSAACKSSTIKLLRACSVLANIASGSKSCKRPTMGNHWSRLASILANNSVNFSALLSM